MSRRGLARLVVARRITMVLVLVAIVLRVGDRAEPTAERLPELDLVVVIDRTTSMSALDDPTGSRFAAATRDLVRLVEPLGSVRFSVVTLGSEAELALPATQDRVAFEDLISHLTTESPTAGRGSSADRAVPIVRRLLSSAAKDPSRLPVLVYVGDGEDTSPSGGPDFSGLDQYLSTALVLGFGTSVGGTMPLDPDRPAAAGLDLVPDPTTGRAAVSHADPAHLQAIADQLGGVFVAGYGSMDMTDIVNGLQHDAYADLPAVESARHLGWAWGLLLTLLALFELRLGWLQWLGARREARA